MSLKPYCQIIFFREPANKYPGVSMIYGEIFYSFADIPEICVFSIYLLVEPSGMSQVSFGFVRCGEFIPDPLLFFFCQIVGLEGALKPFQGKMRHSLFHETVAKQICACKKPARTVIGTNQRGGGLKFLYRVLCQSHFLVRCRRVEVRFVVRFALG